MKLHICGNHQRTKITGILAHQSASCSAWNPWVFYSTKITEVKWQSVEKHLRLSINFTMLTEFLARVMTDGCKLPDCEKRKMRFLWFVLLCLILILHTLVRYDMVAELKFELIVYSSVSFPGQKIQVVKITPIHHFPNTEFFTAKNSSG